MKNWLAGSLAGFIATAPMSASMVWMHRRLPPEEQYALPPAQITEQIAEGAEIREHLDRSRQREATLLLHFGFGATAGALYGPLARRIPGPPALKGMLFGLCVWTASYLGWLPATGILRPATEHTARRNALMIVAHLVWGVVLAALVERWAEESAEL